jgi:hypothetical protein
METDDFLRVISEFDFIRDDIDEIKAQVELTKSEDKKMWRAVENIEKAKNILIELFPTIRSLDTDMREDLEGELVDLD